MGAFTLDVALMLSTMAQPPSKSPSVALTPQRNLKFLDWEAVAVRWFSLKEFTECAPLAPGYQSCGLKGDLA